MSDMRFLITVMCKLRDGILLAAASVICLTPSAAQSQYIQDDYLRRQMQALGAIKDTANAICYTVKQEGQTFQGTLSGDVKAKLENAMSTVGLHPVPKTPS